MALIYLDLKVKGERNKRKLNNEACFSALNKGITGIESVTYWAYPKTTSHNFELRANYYFKQMKFLFPFFPDTNLANIIRRGFTITDTDQYPGMYANFLLRLVRPIQEKPKAIEAFWNWNRHMSSYRLPNALKHRSPELHKFFIDDNKNKMLLVFLLSQVSDTCPHSLAPTQLPKTDVHDVFDNGLKAGCLDVLSTIGERLDEYEPLYDTGSYWSGDNSYIGPEAFAIGKGNGELFFEAINEEQVVDFISALTREV